MSAQQDPLQLTKAAAATVAAAMGNDPYAIVGGAACTLLGSPRVTQDVDFVVPRGRTPAARNKLRSNPAFEVEPRTNHTSYIRGGSKVEIEILAPPGIFKGQFDDSTPCMMINNIRVLQPTLILDAKCRSILGRATEGKKRTDATDISFLLDYIASRRIPIGSDVPNASPEFITWFVQNYGGKVRFEKAGFTVPA
jgi:hypothetical protein